MRVADVITVKLYATLGRNYSITDAIDLHAPRTISSIIDELGIPRSKVTIIFVDGRHADPTATVNPGQTLSLFPPIGGG